jgi:hypothetical protein
MISTVRGWKNVQVADRGLVAWRICLCILPFLSGCGDESRPLLNGPGQPVALALTSISPNNGLISGGIPITLTGTGFLSGATVTMAGASVAVTFINSANLRVTAPAHDAGAVDIVVTNPGGATSALPAAFTYTAALASLTMTGNLKLNAIGETSQLTATATYADGSTRDVTNEARWTSGTPAVATLGPVPTAGLLTARGLGASFISVSYPLTGRPLFKSGQAIVTPPGTFIITGRTREPGAGGVAAATVTHLTSGRSSLTDANGNVNLGGLTGSPRVSFWKEGYEGVTTDVVPDAFADMPLQRVVHAVAGGPPLVGKLAPNDVEYAVTGSTHCQPCRLIRVTSPTAGNVQLKLTWVDPSLVLNVWVNGRIFSSEPDQREVTAAFAAGPTELLVYVGRVKGAPVEFQDYAAFTVTITGPG